ncbi:MAG: PDZ domain-containing protein, partial [Planctomycetes bacterium]|nr:PDZ domain-containing protein [Planctomycetota bacterium]
MRHTPSSRWFAAIAVAVLTTSLASCQQHAAGPPFDPRGTMQSVAMLLEQDHISRHPLDDEVSRQAFAALFDELDPMRLFFLQDDVDGYRPEADRLDDYVRAGDPAFADEVHALLERRVREASALALQQLEQSPDFTRDESISTDTETLAFAATPTELAERWRQRVKLDRLRLEFSGVPADDIAGRLRRRYERMTLESATPERAVTELLDAITGVYDPHTTYFAPRTAADFAMMIRLNYEGIGALLGDDDGRIVVRKLLRGGSAIAAGTLAAGDVILAVGNDDDGELEPIDGMPIDDVVDRIRGPRGTSVRLQVSTGGAPPRIVTLERRKTELQDQLASGEVVEAGSARIGWIDLPGFYADPDGSRSATADVARLLRDFQDQGVSAVVLDLRENGGGLLSEAVSLTGLFLRGGNVVRVRDTDGQTRRFDDPDDGALWSGPLVVLTSRFSASASEILAGAIQDDGRGLVVGDTATHGKGSVQTVVDLGEHPLHRGDHPSGALKLTTQQFFRPGGDSTQLHGVAADIVLPAWTEAVAEGEAALPHALPFRAIAPLVGGVTPARDPRLVERLAAASAGRVAADPGFVAVEQHNR